jgi:hypothetical protein
MNDADLPQPRLPDDSPDPQFRTTEAKRYLGKQLFHDPIRTARILPEFGGVLAVKQTASCGSCHFGEAASKAGTLLNFAVGGEGRGYTDAAELRQDPGGPDGVVEQLLAEVPLRLRGLELRIRGAVGEPRLRKVRVIHGHHQPLDAADLLADECAQFGGTDAPSFVGCRRGAQQGRGGGHGEWKGAAQALGPRFRRVDLELRTRPPWSSPHRGFSLLWSEWNVDPCPRRDLRGPGRRDAGATCCRPTSTLRR